MGRTLVRRAEMTVATRDRLLRRRKAQVVIEAKAKSPAAATATVVVPPSKRKIKRTRKGVKERVVAKDGSAVGVKTASEVKVETAESVAVAKIGSEVEVRRK